MEETNEERWTTPLLAHGPWRTVVVTRCPRSAYSADIAKGTANGSERIVTRADNPAAARQRGTPRTHGRPTRTDAISLR